MYIHSSSTKEGDCKVGKGMIRLFLQKLIPRWGSARDCKELMDSIYAPLYRYLDQEFDNTTKKRIDLSFDEIEEILGEPLPQEAKTSSAWWANDETNVHARAWVYAGWKAHPHNINFKKITFAREASLLEFLESLIDNILLRKHRHRMK